MPPLVALQVVDLASLVVRNARLIGVIERTPCKLSDGLGRAGHCSIPMLDVLECISISMSSNSCLAKAVARSSDLGSQ